MNTALQRPLVVGGIGLTLGLWGLDSMSHSLAGVGDWLPLAVAAGGGYWWYRQRNGQAKVPVGKVEIDRPTLDKALSQVELIIKQLAIESPNSPQIDKLRQELAQVQINSTRLDRQIAITGGQRVGKSSLLKALTSAPVTATTPLKYIKTPALFTSGDASTTAAITAAQITHNADLVMFLTTGDLTATEYKYIAELHQANQRVILLLNQVDRYLPEERNLILQKLKSTVAGTLAAADVISTSTAPTSVKVRKINADGSSLETLETLPVDITSLNQQLTNILATEGEKLLWATTYRQVAGIQITAKTTLNTVRHDRALPLIEQNQWIVAAAAFANPLPALDLLATAAVNAQMVIDLGAIYQQKFSIDQAQAAAGAMGNVMLKLGLVELCTQTIAGLLKTNAITFVAGGLVQGLSAAYLTRIAGLTLVEYLAAQDLVAPEPTRAWNLDLLGNTLQKVFQANQRVAYMQTVVKQGLDRLVPDAVEVG